MIKQLLMQEINWVSIHIVAIAHENKAITETLLDSVDIHEYVGM